MLGTGRNIRQLTGLRGVAALAVVFHHAAGEVEGETLFRGQPMVDIFFVLSGFVLSYVYLSRETIDWKAFARARFARIYPLHIVTAIAMAVAAVLYARLGGKPWPDHVNAAQAFREATLTMALPLVGADRIWNFPAWSISVEWWVYFTLFPLLALCGQRVSIRQALAIFAIAAFALAVYLHAEIDKPTRGWPPLLRAMIGFGGGWLAWRIATTTDLRMPPIASDLVCALTIVTIYSTVPLIEQDAWFLIPVYPLVVFGLATTRSGASRLLASRPAEWLGTISYSIYLVHPIVLNILEGIDQKLIPIGTRAQWIAIAVPASVIAAAISYHVFERPARALLSGSRSKMTPALKA